jgi:hypothetical protein
VNPFLNVADFRLHNIYEDGLKSVKINVMIEKIIAYERKLQCSVSGILNITDFRLQTVYENGLKSVFEYGDKTYDGFIVFRDIYLFIFLYCICLSRYDIFHFIPISKKYMDNL